MLTISEFNSISSQFYHVCSELKTLNKYEDIGYCNENAVGVFLWRHLMWQYLSLVMCGRADSEVREGLVELVELADIPEAMYEIYDENGYSVQDRLYDFQINSGYSFRHVEDAFMKSLDFVNIYHANYYGDGLAKDEDTEYTELPEEVDEALRELDTDYKEGDIYVLSYPAAWQKDSDFAGTCAYETCEECIHKEVGNKHYVILSFLDCVDDGYPQPLDSVMRFHPAFAYACWVKRKEEERWQR